MLQHDTTLPTDKEQTRFHPLFRRKTARSPRGSERGQAGERCCSLLTLTDLWGEAVAHGVHVVAGGRLAHEGVRVAGEAVAVGRREAVAGAAVAREPALVHGGRGQRLRPVQCAIAIWR